MTPAQIDEIRVIIERDLFWRQEELATLLGLLNLITGDSPEEIEIKKGIFRKSVLLSMYAHFEGYFRFAFETYAYSLNEISVEIHKVINVLLISALNEDFEAYDNSNRWVAPNPDETNKKVKKLHNRMVLLKNLDDKKNQKFQLPLSASTIKTSVLHTESNLSPDVIDKILYSLGVHRSLGLDERQFMELMGLTSAFVKKRNGIAHGDNKSEFKNGIPEREFSSFERTFNKIISQIGPIITSCLAGELYLKAEHRV